jgi:hypothetical protein
MFLGLGIIIFPMIFNDTYRMIISMTNSRVRKIDKKCKHLSNFSPVTLRALCYYLINTNRKNSITEAGAFGIEAVPMQFIVGS